MNKLIINKREDKIEVFVYQNNILIEQYEENIEQKRLEGNIYLGKIKNIVKGMQSAFVDIGADKKALIHIKDIINKESSITGNTNLDVEKYDISKVIKPNEDILVQIKRDCTNQKGPRVTKDIKLVGKYVILMPYSKFITVSQKIIDNDERNRLISVVKENLQQKYGIIIRTSALNVSKEIIKNDILELIEKWNMILEKSLSQKAPTELYDNNGIIGKLINDFEPLGLEIYANDEQIKQIVTEINKDIKVQITDEFNDYEINKPRKVWLNCGGYITIDTTEALVAIDVNSGKFIGKQELEKTILKVNLEATKEIARQLQLQDLGGIIVIDFINMINEEDRNFVKEKMQEAIKNDRSKVQILEFTRLGLLEMTRKHILGR